MNIIKTEEKKYDPLHDYEYYRIYNIENTFVYLAFTF